MTGCSLAVELIWISRGSLLMKPLHLLPFGKRPPIPDPSPQPRSRARSKFWQCPSVPLMRRFKLRPQVFLLVEWINTRCLTVIGLALAGGPPMVGQVALGDARHCQHRGAFVSPGGSTIVHCLSQASIGHIPGVYAIAALATHCGTPWACVSADDAVGEAADFLVVARLCGFHTHATELGAGRCGPPT